MTEPLSLRLTSRTAGTVVVVEVCGEIDLATADRVAAAVEAGLAGAPTALVLDLTEVSFLDSAGLSLLARAHMAAGERTPFRVVATQRAVLNPIQLTGMDKMLNLFDTVAGALAAA